VDCCGRLCGERLYHADCLADWLSDLRSHKKRCEKLHISPDELYKGRSAERRLDLRGFPCPLAELSERPNTGIVAPCGKRGKIKASGIIAEQQPSRAAAPPAAVPTRRAAIAAAAAAPLTSANTKPALPKHQQRQQQHHQYSHLQRMERSAAAVQEDDAPELQPRRRQPTLAAAFGLDDDTGSDEDGAYEPAPPEQLALQPQPLPPSLEAGEVWPSLAPAPKKETTPPKQKPRAPPPQQPAPPPPLSPSLTTLSVMTLARYNALVGIASDEQEEQELAAPNTPPQQLFSPPLAPPSDDEEEHTAPPPPLALSPAMAKHIVPAVLSGFAALPFAPPPTLTAPSVPSVPPAATAARALFPGDEAEEARERAEEEALLAQIHADIAEEEEFAELLACLLTT